MFEPDPEALSDTIDYILREWPDIRDANSCARWALRRGAEYSIDQCCGFWSRNEAYL